MNPLSMVSPKVRLALYLAYAVAGIVVTYLVSKGVLGADEVALYGGVGTIFGLTAASNVRTSTSPEEH